MIPESIEPCTDTPLAVLRTSITRSLYLPGLLTVRRLKTAYPLVEFPVLERTLVEVFPVRSTVELVPLSSQSTALAPSCCKGSLLALPTDRTATITGIEKGTPGTADVGGSIVNESE